MQCLQNIISSEPENQRNVCTSWQGHSTQSWFKVWSPTLTTNYTTLIYSNYLPHLCVVGDDTEVSSLTSNTVLPVSKTSFTDCLSVFIMPVSLFPQEDNSVQILFHRDWRSFGSQLEASYQQLLSIRGFGSGLWRKAFHRVKVTSVWYSHTPLCVSACHSQA